MTGTEWQEIAYQHALALIQTQREFTTEDIWDSLHRAGVTLPAGTSARGIGKVMIRLRNRGLALKAEKAPVPHRDSRKVGRMNHAIPVWRSCLFGEPVCPTCGKAA